MVPQEAHWGQVREGSIIREHRTGMLWKVVRDEKVKGKQYVGLRNRDGDEKIIERPQGLAPVTLMVLEPAEAYAVVVEILGAEPIYYCRPGDKIMTAPPWETMDKRERKAHLFSMHGVYLEDGKATKNLDLDMVHETEHAKDAPKGIPHIHLGTPETEQHRRLS